MKQFVRASGNVNFFLVLLLCSLSLVAGKRPYSFLPGFEITLNIFHTASPSCPVMWVCADDLKCLHMTSWGKCIAGPLLNTLDTPT